MNESIRQFFAAMLQLAPDDVVAESKPSDIPKWDSMQHLILISSVEEEFGVVIDPDEIVGMYDSYGNFEKVIVGKLPS